MIKQMSFIARMASSFAGMGCVISFGLAFVSTIPTMGIPNLLASWTASCSFLVSTMNTRDGSCVISLIPPK